MKDDQVIQLTPFGLQDFSRLISWIGSPEELVQWAGPRLFTYPLDITQLTVHQYETLGQAPRSRIYKALAEDGRVIGHVEFGGIDARDGMATLCRVMVAPEERGKGLCLPMVRGGLKLGFEELHFRRIELNVYSFNLNALACYQRAGFVREGLARKTVQVGDQFWDTVTMAILKEEWNEN